MKTLWWSSVALLRVEVWAPVVLVQGDVIVELQGVAGYSDSLGCWHQTPKSREAATYSRTAGAAAAVEDTTQK